MKKEAGIHDSGSSILQHQYRVGIIGIEYTPILRKSYSRTGLVIEIVGQIA
jgi:hypothetical protein